MPFIESIMVRLQGVRRSADRGRGSLAEIGERACRKAEKREEALIAVVIEPVVKKVVLDTVSQMFELNQWSHPKVVVKENEHRTEFLHVFCELVDLVFPIESGNGTVVSFLQLRVAFS
jgi:hypothetical protein